MDSFHMANVLMDKSLRIYEHLQASLFPYSLRVLQFEIRLTMACEGCKSKQAEASFGAAQAAPLSVTVAWAAVKYNRS